MSWKSENSRSSFLDKLTAQLVLGKRGSKRLDKKKAKRAAERIINPADLIKPEDLPEEEVQEKPTLPTKDSKESVISKLEKISDPRLLIINSKVSDTLAEDEDEQVAEERRLAYQEFFSAKKEVLKSCINLTNEDDIHAWIVDASQVKDLDDSLRFHQIANQFLDLPADLINHGSPFEDIKVRLKGVNKDSMRDDLSQVWNDIVGEPKVEDTENPNDEENKGDQEGQEGKEDQEGQDGSDENELLDSLPDIKDVDSNVNLSKIKKLKNPYLFVLSPKDPDTYQEFVTNSKILPKLQKSGTMFLDSEAKTKIGAALRGTSVYFVDESDVRPLLEELKTNRPVYRLGQLLENDETIEDFFNKEDPFSDVTLKGVKLDDRLVSELNGKWKRHTSGSSGNVVPAVQINNRIPINFLRLLSKKQRDLDMYLGDRPTGAGMSGAAYIPTTSESEAAAYLSLMKKFKMPSLFYKYFYVDADIDDKFKRTDPQPFTPSNVLILMGAFKPKEPVTITEEHKGIINNTDATTQLDLLHAFADKVLKNPVKNHGSFVQGQYFIGTTVANFNVDMSVCFLWGSVTQKITLDKGEVLKQLPFVDKLITSYL